MQVGEFTLINEEKVERALNGSPMQNGSRKGGVAKEDGSFDELELITAYDRMVGLIVKGEDKLKHGCFFDFKTKKARATPEITFIYRVNGKEIEVKDGVELPGIVKAAKIMEEEIMPKKKVRKTK